MKFLSLLLYNLIVPLYSLVAYSISPFNPKAKKWIEGRKTVWKELSKLPPNKNRTWFHCSSLGEYEQALPLIERLKTSSEIIVTFFSPSGYEIVKRKDPNALIFYLPTDSAANAKRLLDILQPQMAVFVRYDLWYYYLTELQNRNIKSILISAVYGEKDIFFQWYGSLFNAMLKSFAHIFVQDEDSKNVLLKNGFQNVTKAGDTRIDRVVALANEGRQFSVIEKFKGDKKLFIVGSLEPGDEDVALPFVNNPEFSKHFKFIIAPHRVDKSSVEKLRSTLKGSSALYSNVTSETSSNFDVIIIDSIGILSRLYAYTDMAYIGGGFGEGLHNVLEPAVWGIPILFGPKHQKFIEAVELVNREGAFVVQDAANLKAKVSTLLADNNLFKKSGQATANFILERKGATDIISGYLLKK